MEIKQLNEILKDLQNPDRKILKTDSYGDGKAPISVQIVKAKQKTITVYEYE